MIDIMASFYGETICTEIKRNGERCNNKAYYVDNIFLRCGVHSNKSTRQELPKNPNKNKIKEDKIDSERNRAIEVAENNRKLDVKGKLIVTKLYMMKEPHNVDGYYKIFPNFKHGNRKDGYGCPNLSPKALGPVNHIMPNLPPAKTLENFHQFAKVFPFETDDNGLIKEKYFGVRRDGYNDPIPHRHKYDPKILKNNKKEKNNINIPLYSVYYDKHGIEYRYNYFESRYFYCKVYERLTTELPELRYLRDLLNSGYNLNIVGYDGYNVNKSLWECYCDTSKPFGHELVLYTLLVEEDSKNYPWNIAYERNKEIYEGVGIN